MSAHLPVFGPTEPLGDEEHEPDVIVRVDFLMSREQITTALGIAWAEGVTDSGPEGLTVVETRHEVEAYLSVQAFHALGDQMERDRRRTWSPEQQAVMQLLAAAVDRAYPAAGDASALGNASPAVQQPRYGDGMVTLQTVDAGEITIDEPAWCEGHDGQQVGQRVDVTHKGPWICAEFEGIEFLPACISWAPFAEKQPEPFPVLDVDEFPPMDPDQLRQLAGVVGLYSGELYTKADEAERLRDGGTA